jgi:hypothetical protein
MYDVVGGPLSAALLGKRFDGCPNFILDAMPGMVLVIAAAPRSRIALKTGWPSEAERATSERSLEVERVATCARAIPATRC